MIGSDESDLDELERTMRAAWNVQDGVLRKGSGCAPGSKRSMRLISSHGGMVSRGRRKPPPVSLATSAKDFERKDK